MQPKIFDIRERSFIFSTKIIQLTYFLPRNLSGNAIGNQIVRSGCSVGANIEEAQNSCSRKEFIHGMTIALKEARETNYWLRLIEKTDTIIENSDKDLVNESEELIKILITIVKKSKIEI